MTDDSAVRRVSPYLRAPGWWIEKDDGTHHLSKIDDYEVVKRKTWERVVEVLDLVNAISASTEITGHHLNGDPAAWDEFEEFADVPKLLAEIGEVKGE